MIRAATSARPTRSTMLAEFVALQVDKADSSNSWTLDVEKIDTATWDLSVKNPNTPEAEALRSPEQIIADMLARDAETAVLLEEVRGLL